MSFRVRREKKAAVSLKRSAQYALITQNKPTSSLTVGRQKVKFDWVRRLQIKQISTGQSRGGRTKSRLCTLIGLKFYKKIYFIKQSNRYIMVSWCSWLSRLLNTQTVASSSLAEIIFSIFCQIFVLYISVVVCITLIYS